MPQSPQQTDCVDALIQEWRDSWPDLPTDAFGVIGRILLLSHHLKADRGLQLREFDLQTGEFDVLATLRRAGAPYALSMSKLCRDVMLTSGGMTHRVDRLVDRGLVTREHDSRDRRTVLVSLTDEGRALVESALPRKTAHAEAITAALSREEAEILKGLLRRLLRQLEHGG